MEAFIYTQLDITVTNPAAPSVVLGMLFVCIVVMLADVASVTSLKAFESSPGSLSLVVMHGMRIHIANLT